MMLPNSPRILVIGYNAFDITVPFDHYPDLDSKTEVPFIRLGGGGPGATAAAAMSKLGAKVQLITALTDDPGGITQKMELTEAGVDLTYSPLLSGQECAKAVILARPGSGERTIFWSRGNLPRLQGNHWRNEWLEGIDLLYIDGHEPEVSLLACECAQEKQIPVVFDAGSVRQGSPQLVEVCTDVISSAVFATALTQVDDAFTALSLLKEKGPLRVAMTFGSSGVLGLSDEFVTVPSFQVDAVDTTGAGDVFHAGYAVSLAHGRSFLENLEFGAAAAALKCTHWGGRGHLPGYQPVMDLTKHGLKNPLGPPLDLPRS